MIVCIENFNLEKPTFRSLVNLHEGSLKSIPFRRKSSFLSGSNQSFSTLKLSFSRKFSIPNRSFKMTHFLSRKRCVSPLLPSLRNAHPRRWPTWSATWFPDDRKLIFFRNFHFFIAPHCPTRRKRRKTSGSFPHGNMWGACVGGHNCHLSRTHTRAFFFLFVWQHSPPPSRLANFPKV